MNAVTLEEGARPICTIALGCFCEAHGPTIVFTTQAFPSSALAASSPSSPTTASSAVVSSSSPPPSSSLVLLPRRSPVPVPSSHHQQQQQQQQQTTQQLPPAASAPLWVPPPPSSSSGGVSHSFSSSSSSSSSLLQTPQQLPANATCPLCASLPESAGFVTGDGATAAVLVSKRTLAESYPIVRQAVIRALSCEWSPRDAAAAALLAPVVHGSAAVGYTLSFLFRVEDSGARGAGRWYAVVSTWQDPTYLAAAACSGILRAAILPLVADVQRRAASARAGDWRGGGIGAALHPHQQRPQQLQQHKQRSLADIVGVPPKLLYRCVHNAFCAALIACDRRLFASGPAVAPQFYPTRTLLQPPPHHHHHKHQQQHQQQQQQQPTAPKVRLTWLLDAVGPRGVRVLIYGCVVGCQVVVRAPDPLRVSAVRAVSRLLPDVLRGAVCEDSPEYKQPWEAHFLGVPLTAQLRDVDVEDVFDTLGGTFIEGDSVVLTIDADGKRVSVTGPYEPTTVGEEIRAALAAPNDVVAAPAGLQALRLQLVHERWLNLAKVACALRARGAFNTEAGTNAALAALHIGAKDLRVLTFWSACVRRRLLSAPSL